MKNNISTTVNASNRKDTNEKKKKGWLTILFSRILDCRKKSFKSAAAITFSLQATSIPPQKVSLPS